MKGLLILGFGGHARSIADVALAAGVSDLLFIDKHSEKGEDFLGFKVQRDFDSVLPEDWLCFPAAGDNQSRHDQIAYARHRGWPLATVIAPTATVGVGTYIAPGSFIAHHAHVGPMVHIGEGGLINTGAVVEHECNIGDYVHISVNATVAGRAVIGDFSFIGAGAVALHNVSICDHVTVGAGSVILDNITVSGVYVGIPGRRIEK